MPTQTMSKIAMVGDNTLEIATGRDRVLVINGPIHVRGALTINEHVGDGDSPGDGRAKSTNLGVVLKRCEADQDVLRETVENIQKELSDVKRALRDQEREHRALKREVAKLLHEI